MPPERNIETCTWSVEPCCPGRGSHHRSGSILHHRNGGGRLYGTGHHTVLCHCRTGMLLRRTMLCGICIHDTRSRQRIHLLVCHDGRTHRLDYRVGPGTGIHRSRNHGKHQLEPLSGRLSRGLDIHLPQALTACPWDGGVVNIPAFLIVVLMSLFLIRGTEGSSIFNGFIVFLKVSVILILSYSAGNTSIPTTIHLIFLPIRACWANMASPASCEGRPSYSSPSSGSTP